MTVTDARRVEGTWSLRSPHLALELVLLDVQGVFGRHVVQAEFRQLEAADLLVVEPQQVLQVGDLNGARHRISLSNWCISHRERVTRCQ